MIPRSLVWALIAAVGFALATRPGAWGPLAWPAAVALQRALRVADGRASAARAAAVAAFGPASVAVTPLAPLQPSGALLALVAIAASFALVGLVAAAARSRAGADAAVAGPVPTALVASFAWIAVERAWGARWLLGDAAFPVVAIGSALVDGPVRRIAALGGTSALGLTLLLVAGAVEGSLRRRAPAWARASALAGLLALASATHAWADPLPPGGTAVADGPVLRLRLAQHRPVPAAIAAARVDPASEARLLAPLRSALDDADGRLIVWPETAWPHPLDPGDPTDAPVLGDGAVLFGAITTREGQRYNSVLLSDGGRLAHVADKVRLVPLTESSLTAGRAGRTHAWRGVVLGAAVCWDAAFADVARVAARAGAQVLIYLADDGYAFAGPVGRLHLRQARLRALETRRPVVLVQATGPSAAISADGRLVASLPSGVRGHLDVDLPLAAPSDVGPVGADPVGAALAALLPVWLALRLRAARSKGGGS
jgi:apolipoprotein N-acyltransferase